MSAAYYADESVTLYHGDCLDVLRTLPDNSVDSVVTDPPYGLEFMGKGWDSFSDGTASSKATAGMSGTGYTDGANRIERPSFMGGTNPKCRTCDRWQRGANPCSCDAPDFPNERRARSAAFGDWCELWTAECLRVLKPGGHMLAFGGTRTWHRLACAVEDAGFEVRDSIAWLYGSGFPKSLDVSKAIDKRGGADIGWFGPWLRVERRRRGISSNELAKHFLSKTGGETGCVRNWELSLNLPTPDQFNTLCRVLNLPFAEISEAHREVTGRHRNGVTTGDAGLTVAGVGKERHDIPATDDARKWAGFGTALKPAFEPVVVARKPLVGTVAANVLTYGTGALNIDATRIAGDVPSVPQPVYGVKADGVTDFGSGVGRSGQMSSAPGGRWPANVALDDTQADVLDEQTGTLTSGANPTRRGSDKFREAYGDFKGQAECTPARGVDKGGASRFFYVAKAPKRERPNVDGTAHPTVKPLTLMRWLVRLVTPPGGTVLEPFAGSGTTVEACLLEDLHCIAIEKTPEYLPLILARIQRQTEAREAVEPDLFNIDTEATA